MASVSDIRDQIKIRLETITGVTGYDRVPDQINVPAAITRRASTSYDSTMARGSDDYAFTVTVLVSYSDPDVAHDALDAYMASAGAGSVKAAVEGGGGDLGGTAHFVRVTAVGEDYIATYNDTEYLAIDFTLEVTGSGT